MREEGIICLVELCFISNKDDLQKLFSGMTTLATKHAEIIARYEKMVA